MMFLEAKNGGAFWGAAFRKFSTLRTDYLRVPAERFLNSWNRFLPIPCQLTWGEGAPAESFSTPIDSAGALSPQARRTGTQRQR
jgi:hypothetical protein